MWDRDLRGHCEQPYRAKVRETATAGSRQGLATGEGRWDCRVAQEAVGAQAPLLVTLMFKQASTAA